MRKWKAWLFALAVLIGIGTIGTVSMKAEAQNLNQGKRVLFISSYSYGWDTVQTQIEGIKAGVDENTTIDYEFMDTKRFRTDEWLNMFHDMLKYHLENTDPYDVVIVGDDAALQFAMEYREELFPEIPVVFEGVNDEEYAMKAAENPLVTGIIEKLSVEKNIDMALKVNPTADKVVAILDDSVTADAERKNFYNSAENYPELEFSEINAAELETARLQQAISKADCSIPPAIIPAYRFPFRNMVGAAFFLHLDIENDHIGPGIPFKLRKNSRLITIFIHNICIRKKADVPFRPKDGLIAASADATVGKTAETDSSVPRRYLHFLLPQPVALIDDHRIRLQVHMLYGLRKRSIHYRCQNFYLHACSPPCSVFCVCMAPGRK